MLRQPLENGKVTISRAHSTVSYPAKFIFIAAMNPCPCGYRASSTHYCSCSDKQVTAYQNRVSGPIRDRIDILLSLKPVNLQEATIESMETSEVIRNRVIAARKQQYERYGTELTNSEVLFDQLVSKGQLAMSQQKIIQSVCAKQGLSNRAHIKIIRLARTISDLDGNVTISNRAIVEAFQLRKVEVMPSWISEFSLEGDY